jgi:hypothetical protein
MPKVPRRARVFTFPHNAALFDSHLDTFYEETGTRGVDIVFDLHILRLVSPVELRDIGGLAHEVARGERVPMRLRFSDAEWLARSGPFEDFNHLPQDHGARRFFGFMHSRQPDYGEFYWATTASAEEGFLALRARRYWLEAREGTVRTVEVARRWSLTPPAPAGLVPMRPVLHRRYGGDPIAVHIGGRTFRNRLFIGGLHHQREERPQVDHVLNLCGIGNPWVDRFGQHPDDRFVCKGEMAAGMDLEEILEETDWVVERIRTGESVLVHCAAGMNRSSTICCAALIVLEGIAAEEALARVRERHPIAWPDPYHWFLLRWLATPEARAAAEAQRDATKEASLLRETAPIQ